MLWRLTICRQASLGSRRYDSIATSALQPVTKLPSWNIDHFRNEAFIPARPAQFAPEPVHLPPACQKWFIHEDNATFDIAQSGQPKSSGLRESFWKDHKSLIVPLELTAASSSKWGESTFHRSDGPLKLLLDHLAESQPLTHSLYLAQCPLPSLPPNLQADLPTPQIILKVGRGDIYDSSLWLGRPPTYTPLHRDPNPNLLMQLAGTKAIRLFPPDVGLVIFERVQERMGENASSMFRGEEMMQGAEKELLEREVWDDDGSSSDAERTALLQAGYEATVTLGEAIFIPKGWWHSVKGVGQGITASANWWFR